MNIMKTVKLISTISIVLIAASVISCKKEEAAEPIKATSVVVTPATASVQRGGTLQLEAHVLPSNAADQSIVWSSYDEKMAIVDASGFVRTLRPGFTYIVATSGDGKAKNACRVEIKWAARYYVLIQDASGGDIARLYSYPGSTASLKAVCEPAGSHTYTWSSSIPDAVSVDASGNVNFKYPEYREQGDYIYWSKGFVQVESEDTYSDQIEVCCNIRSEYMFNGSPRGFGDDYGIAASKSYDLALLWNNGSKDVALPLSQYSISSDNAVVSVSKSGDHYVVTTGSSIGQAARLSATLSNGVVIDLGRYIVSESVAGGNEDYVEDVR